MKTIRYLLWVLLFAAPWQSFAQTSFCYFDSLWNEKAIEDSMLTYKHNAHISRVNQFRQNTQLNYNVIPYGVPPQGLGSGPGCRDAIFVVPVVVHVVYDPNIPQSNLPDSLVEKQIEILNRAFANEINSSSPFGVNTGIQFCLAQKDPFGSTISGINHISDANPVNSIFNNAQKNHLAGFAYYDNQRYLNIWVVPDIDGAAGYSNTPYMNGVDGVVMEYDYFGDYSECSTCGFDNMSRGLILAHEVGHYLGLFHPFQGECVGTTASTCSIQGDFCCDTRPTKENHNCPVPSTNQCAGLAYYAGESDNYENFMAYADDACRDNFTPDQVSVLQSVLSNDRTGLVSVDNVNSLSLSCCLTACWFNISNGFLCLPDSITFKAIEHTSADYRWQIYNDTVQVLDTTLSVASFSWTLSRYGRYSVKLSVITGSDSVILDRTNLIELRDCGPVMASTQGNWYFGKYAGLQFRTGGPIVDISAAIATPVPTVKSGDGGISHSAPNGNLLFYAGGDSAGQNILRLYRPIANNHTQVNQAAPLYGHQSSSQTGIVIPFKHDSTRFHLFVVDAAYELEGGCYHNILDIDTPNLAMSGSSNLPLPVPAGSYTNAKGSVLAVELITSVPACDSNHWLIIADGASGAYANSHQLLVYYVTDSTVTYVTKSNDKVPTYYGQLKASPDGTKIAAPGAVFNFDRATGAITTFKKLPDDDRFVRYYGTSFSPDSRLLYYVLEENSAMHIYQYDLESSDSLLSRQRVPTESTFFTTALQLGPDGKLYVAKPGYDELAVISNPNQRITLLNPNVCGFDAFGPSLKDAAGNGGTCLGGLPNMMDAKYPSETLLSFSMVDSACGNVKYYPNEACASSYHWDFGDGDSSIAKEPIHHYADTGTYLVTLTINGVTQVNRSIRIGIDKPIISGDTVVSCNLDDLTVYSISNVEPEFEYTWWTENGNVLFIEEIENAHVKWDSNGVIYVQAMDLRNRCSSFDSLPIRIGDIRNNAIQYSGGCYAGDSIAIDGNPIQINYMDSNVHFQWQYYTISSKSAWRDISSLDTFEDFSNVVPDSAVWFRRIAYNAFCESISDSVYSKTRANLITDLKDLASCSIAPFTYGFPIEIVASDSNDIIYMDIERYQLISPYYYDWLKVDDGIYPDTLLIDVTAGDSVRIKLKLDGCDSSYSKSIAVRLFDLQIDSTNNPSCDNVQVSGDLGILDDGIDTFIVAILDSSYNWIYQTSNCDSFFQWEYAKTATSGFSALTGAKNDTLYLTTNSCNTGFYRVKFKGRWQLVGYGCYPVASCNTSELRIEPDLWSMDGAQDTGAEPNIDSNNDYWNSPDLWNCWQNTSCSSANHESPEYMTSGYNHVKATIRNKGQNTSDSFKVYLYWTLGGFFEKWPLSWTNDTINNGFYNPNFSQTFPMGSEIDSFHLPGLSGGADTTLDADWEPPHPSWYDTSSYYNADQVKHPLCILSRIVTCDDTPYGMTYEEMDSTGRNVINNNNIVTRNTEVQDSIAFNKKSPVYVLRMGNQAGGPRKLRIALDNVISNYWSLGYFTVRFDQHIYDAWVSGGMSGANYALNSDEFKVNRDGFYIDNINLDSNVWGWMYVQFHLNPGVSITTYQGAQLFRFIQLASDTTLESYEVNGGFNFLLNLLPAEIPDMVVPIKPEADQQEGAEVLSWIQEIDSVDEHREGENRIDPVVIVTTAKAYPNPSAGLIYFDFNLDSERLVEIELYSSLGVRVKHIPEKTYSKGMHMLTLDGSRLAPGPYLAKIKVNGEIKTITVIIAR